jgi:Flp pilus assembly protein TadG
VGLAAKAQPPETLLGIASTRMCARKIAHRFWRDQSGNYAIIMGLALPVILGFVALGTEGGLWYFRHQSMQSAADSSAVSAAVAYSAQGSAADITAQADSVAAAYGFTAGSSGVTVTVNRPPQSGNYTTQIAAVEVIIQQPQSRLFSAVLTSAPLTILARAVALGNNGGKACVLALDANASGAGSVQGNAPVVLNNCSLADNSNNATALTVGGSGTISALSVSVTGGVSGASSITTTQGIATGQAPTRDPYASTYLPPFSGCDQHNYTAKKTVTINPGVYCGGINLNAGANVTLDPGIYYLDQGSFTVNGGATITGTGVTLVFTSSTGSNYATANINGGATVNLTAPTSGPLAGIVFYGDPNMPVGTSFKFEGGATQVLTGAVYLPKGAVSFAGGASTTTGCTQLIGDTINFTGSSNFAINCSGYGTKPIGSALAKLVE